MATSSLIGFRATNPSLKSAKHSVRHPDFEGSLEALDRALRLQPDHTEAAWDRAIALLHLGRFEQGWPAYEARWHLGELPERRAELPVWQGEDLTGRTILMMPEQGFGDTILASRFLPLLKARGATVWLECKPPLWRLFEERDYVDRLVRLDEPVLEADYRCTMMSLPGRLGIDLGNLPPPPPLHIPDAARVKMRGLLAPLAGRFTVGIVWSGSVTFKNNRNRAVPLGRFLPLAEIPGLRLVSLQKGPPESQLRESGADTVCLDLGRQIEDFAETAAACELLDLIVMTDNSVAHLAASLGRPVWNLLNFVPYWLYLSDSATTPWYPSMRLFRQPAPGDWDSVFAEARTALAEAVAAASGP